MVAEAIAVATTAPYAGYAAIGAACHNIQNVACINHTKQYFACKPMQRWLDISAIIALVSVGGIGVVDGGGGGDAYADDGIGYMGDLILVLVMVIMMIMWMMMK